MRNAQNIFPPSNVNVLTLSHQVEDSRPAAIFMWANKTTVQSSRSVEAKLRPEPNETGLFARIGYTNKHSTDFVFYGIRTANLFELRDMLVVLTPTWTHLMSQFYFLCLQRSVDKLQFCFLGFFSKTCILCLWFFSFRPFWFVYLLRLTMTYLPSLLSLEMSEGVFWSESLICLPSIVLSLHFPFICHQSVSLVLYL